MKTMSVQMDSQQAQAEIGGSVLRRPNWSYLLLSLCVLLLVSGAYVIKTRSGPPRPGEPTNQEELMKSGLDALYAQNNPAVAAVFFTKLLKVNPAHYGATFQLAMALDRDNRPDEARLYWENVRKMAQAVNDSATAATAKARLEKPLQPKEQQSALMKAGIDALYTQGNPAAAAVEFRKLLALNPNHYGATYQLANALDRAGKSAEARPVWEAVLKMAASYNDKPTEDAARARLARTP